MTDSVGQMASRYFQAIADRLQQSRQDERATAALASDDLDSLVFDNGSRLFPPSGPAPMTWCILSPIAGADPSPGDGYLLEAELRSDLPLAEFATQAFEVIAGGVPSSRELAQLVSRVAGSPSPKHDVLRLILDSVAASAAARQVLVLPQSMLDGGVPAD